MSPRSRSLPPSRHLPGGLRYLPRPLRCCTVPALAAFVATSTPLAAQDVVPAHTHIRHVAETFRGTPDGQGLLPTAIAEAEIAVRHAVLAAADTADLEAMKRHAGHVIHALDPAAIEGGPGLGYGLVRAAERTAHYAELSVAADGGGEALQTHAPHVAAAARSALTFAEEALDVGRTIMEAESATEAAAMVRRLAELTTRAANGHDADEDGRVGWQEGEGGLAQARQHLDFLLSGEGLTGG